MKIFNIFLIAVFVSMTLSTVVYSKSNDSGQPDVVATTYPKPKIADNNVVAHRGAYKETGYPDNSMAALKAAISLGCFASECDIHITKDNKVVVYHDDTFKGLIFKNATYAELCAAGTLSNGEKLPLFEEFIDAVLNAGTTILFVDVKSVANDYGGDSYAILAGQGAAEIVRNKKAKNFVKFIVGHEAVFIKCLEASRGDWECGYMNKTVGASIFKANGFTWANFQITKFYQNQAFIQTFKDLGIRVSTYNADTEDQMRWFIAQNMYAICTNYPTKLMSLVRNK